jgi:Clathrin adaptor complex small chain
MGIRFVLFVNKQGQTRLAQYFEHLSLDERRALEGEIVRRCLARTDQQVPLPLPLPLLLSVSISFSSQT